MSCMNPAGNECEKGTICCFECDDAPCGCHCMQYDDVEFAVCCDYYREEVDNE